MEVLGGTMSEKYRGPRVVPDRIIGPKINLTVWLAMMLTFGIGAWVAVFVAAWWVFKR